MAIFSLPNNKDIMFTIHKNNKEVKSFPSFEEAKIFLLSTAYQVDPAFARAYGNEVDININEKFVHQENIWIIINE